jgi:hypothetical protein
VTIFNGTRFVVAPGAGASATISLDTFTGPTTLSTVTQFQAFAPAFTGGLSIAQLADGEVAAAQGAGGTGAVRLFDASGNQTGGFIPFAGFSGAIDVSWFDAAHLAVSAGAGGSPLVKLYDVSSLGSPTPTASFFAFTPAFTGGVDVAWIDATHLVVGEASAGAQVSVFDLSGGPSQTLSFAAFSGGYTGGVTLAGSADGHFAVGTASSADHVKVYDSAGTLTADFIPFSAGYTGGVDVAWLDLTHLAVTQQAGGSEVRIFDLSTGTPILEQDASAYAPAFMGGAHVANIGALPAASIGSVSAAEGISGTTPLVFTVSLNHASQSTVSIDYATQDGTATVASGDYVATNGTLTFLPGETTKTITVLVNGDTVFEPNETFSLVLSHPGNTSLAGNIATGTILDDDALVHLVGTPGNDSFTALPGNERIDALGGIDAVTFGFKLVDAMISFVGNQVIVDGPSGSHTILTGFEVYNFTDGTVNNADGDPLVDDLFYYSRSHDVWTAHADADAHYHSFGWHEGRDPDAFFSTSTYLSLNPGVRAAAIDPLVQFDQGGWRSSDPSIAFDVNAYLNANPDVRAAGVDPLAHFLANGAQEGRSPIAPSVLLASNGFDYVYYLQHNPDVAAAHVDPLAHYETVGWQEGRNPNAYFDTAGYLAHYADVAAVHINPLDHYNQTGWHEGRDPSVNFDTTDYLSHYGDVAAAHVNPLVHFLQSGMAEGRSSFADGVWG